MGRIRDALALGVLEERLREGDERELNTVLSSKASALAPALQRREDLAVDVEVIEDDETTASRELHGAAGEHGACLRGSERHDPLRREVGRVAVTGAGGALAVATLPRPRAEPTMLATST